MRTVISTGAPTDAERRNLVHAGGRFLRLASLGRNDGGGGDRSLVTARPVGHDRQRRSVMAFPVDPPFRAEHIGSLIRPPGGACRAGGARGRADRRRRVARGRGRGDREIRRRAGRARVPFGLRRGVPPPQLHRQFRRRGLRGSQDRAQRRSKLALYQPGGRDLRRQRLGRRGPAGLGGARPMSTISPTSHRSRPRGACRR